MFNLNICQQIYPILLIKSIGKKSFQSLGEVVNKTGKTIRRWMLPADQIFEQNIAIAKHIFANKKTLHISIDDTTINKMHSRVMRGTGWFRDSMIGRKILSYKVLCATIGNNRHLIPIGAIFLFDKDLLDGETQSRDDIVENMILSIIRNFPDKNIIVAMDGLFATIEILSWAAKNGIKVEVRMHRTYA